jgi:hypothetical protein
MAFLEMETPFESELQSLVVDYVKSVSSRKRSRTSYDRSFGSIEFRRVHSNVITVNSIYIHEGYRNRGIAKAFLRCLIDTSPMTVQIESVVSPIMLHIIKTFNSNGRRFRFIRGEWTFEIRSPRPRG